MLFLRLLIVILWSKCAVSGVLDEKCFDNCSCCIDEKCGHGVYNWTNVCTIGCIDGHRGARCYELCQYPNCKSCGFIDKDTTCRACYDGYYLGKYKDCTRQCPSNCKSCTSSTKCNECKDGFYDKDGSTTCKYAHCPAKCECNGQGDCVSCKKGVYDTSTSCTKQCPVNCLSCVSEEICSECNHGFYIGYEYDNTLNLQLNNCTYVCRDNCTHCQSYNKCLQCKDGKYGQTCQENCSKGCNDKTCLFDSGQCGCTKDFTGDKCMKCVDGKYGRFCKQICSKYCKGQICERTSGTCSAGCINDNISGTTCNTCIVGMFGELCDKICPKNCKDFRCERYNGICIDGCTPNFNGTKCDQCIHGNYGTNCELSCPVKYTEAQQQNDASNSGLVATAAVLGSMFMLSLAINIVLLALFLLKKRKGSRRKHGWTEREPTYQNQLVDIAEQTPRTTRDATDTLHSETVERSVYEGMSGVNGRFTFVNSKWPGSSHDSFVFRSSALSTYLDANNRKLEDGIILGDSGYACMPYMMTPYRVTDTASKERFNRAHCRARVVIEMTFGRWKRRFGILHSEMRLKPLKASKVIIACAVLHNIAILLNEPDFDDLLPNQPQPANQYNGPEEGRLIRDYITTTYFQ